MSGSYYFDTSALLKKYFFESGADCVKKLLEGSNDFYTSTLTYAEVYASFHWHHRRGHIDRKTLGSFKEIFEEDWKFFSRVALALDVCESLPSVTHDFPLRGADAVHMATFVHLNRVGISTTFVASDKILLNAIEDFGGKWINPEDV